MSDTQIKILEKSVDYALIQNKVNELEIRQDFDEFSRKMSLKRYFRNEAAEDFSERPSFRCKSSWKPPQGNASLELFLSQTERELFEIPKKRLGYSNFSKEEWECLRSLANDRSIVIKKWIRAHVWDREDYIVEAEKQLSDKNMYRDVNFKSKILQDLAEISNDIFKNLKRKGKITEKELKYFIINHKKATKLGKMYLLPKIHERLYDVPGRPVISNCGAPIEKFSGFLDNQLKPVMREGMSYSKDSNDFMHKIRDLKDIPNDALLVTADVVALYPSILHEAGFQALKEVLECREDKKISSNDLVKMAAFVLKNNYFEFNREVKHNYQGLPLVQNLLLYMLSFLWTK